MVRSTPAATAFRQNTQTISCKFITTNRYVHGDSISMKTLFCKGAFLFFLVPAGAFCGTNVLNMSHYDMMRPDFGALKSQGIVGVIHEATYPPFARDPKYLDRQMGALQAGLLWGAYHYANASDP